MKIGIEAQRLYRKKKHGMEIVALEILQHLQKTDTFNEYYIFVRNDEDMACITPSDNFNFVTIIARSYATWEQFRLPKEIKKIKPAFLHCTANTAPLYCPVPLIITIHDVIYLENLNFSGSWYQNFGNIYRRFIVPKVAKKARVIITVSEYEKKVIGKRLNLAEEKIRVIYNAANPEFKLIPDRLLRAIKIKYKLPDSFILHFGNTAPKKNTKGVLKAYSIYSYNKSNSIPLVITDCSKEFIVDLLKQINQPELINKIMILNYVPFSEVPFLYNLATVFLYPSHRESFGMPVIEAMACGTPVITSNTSALPEIAGGAACLIDPQKPEEIAASIESLLKDPRFYMTQVEKGIKNVMRFNWKDAAEKTLSIYKEFE